MKMTAIKQTTILRAILTALIFSNTQSVASRLLLEQSTSFFENLEEESEGYTQSLPTRQKDENLAIISTRERVNLPSAAPDTIPKSKKMRPEASKATPTT